MTFLTVRLWPTSFIIYLDPSEVNCCCIPLVLLKNHWTVSSGPKLNLIQNISVSTRFVATTPENETYKWRQQWSSKTRYTFGTEWRVNDHVMIRWTNTNYEQARHQYELPFTSSDRLCSRSIHQSVAMCCTCAHVCTIHGATIIPEPSCIVVILYRRRARSQLFVTVKRSQTQGHNKWQEYVYILHTVKRPVVRAGRLREDDRVKRPQRPAQLG